MIPLSERLSKNGIHGRVTSQKPLLTHKNRKAHLNFAFTFWEHVLWTDYSMGFLQKVKTNSELKILNKLNS